MSHMRPQMCFKYLGIEEHFINYQPYHNIVMQEWVKGVFLRCTSD